MMHTAQDDHRQQWEEIWDHIKWLQQKNFVKQAVSVLAVDIKKNCKIKLQIILQARPVNEHNELIAPPKWLISTVWRKGSL